jgi:hypothetical protein
LEILFDNFAFLFSFFLIDEEFELVLLSVSVSDNTPSKVRGFPHE